MKNIIEFVKLGLTHVKKSSVPSAETVTIYTVADVHLGATECDEREWDSSPGVTRRFL